MKPPVPMEFVGNLVLWAYPKLRVKEVLHGSYGHVAKAIHDALAKIDHKYFQSFIDFGEKASRDEEELETTSQLEIGNTMCPNLEVDSWMRFQFHELDFGGEALVLSTLQTYLWKAVDIHTFMSRGWRCRCGHVPLASTCSAL
ncbi:hypothetical protein Scep_012916 [Stephania cephalantha]|uniref:Uncharacterized protein n=1 Tax=Stephania cephalantha TaxID=152367 RepID=A0AAP0P752_9MAGN